MRKLFLIFVLIAVAGCGSRKAPNTTAEKPAESNPRVMVGELSKEDLLLPPHAFWYNAHYKSYTPSEEELAVIKNNISDYDIKIFMGTWCADSQREVPRFFKLLELGGGDLSKVEMEGVRLDKTLPGGLEAHYEVERVPTIIFYKDGKEVNRFVEFPRETLEEDVARIVSGKDYKHVWLD